MKTILDLEAADCRWPVTDTKPFLFCGEPKQPGSSYCACHKPLSVDREQPVLVKGAALARMADAFAGGRTRRSPSMGGERGRTPVDSRIRQTLNSAGAIMDWRAAE